MGDDDDAPSWKVFSGHISAQDIDLGLGTLMTRNVDYVVDGENITGGEARITIDFSGAMAPGNYTLAYKETNDEDCFRTVVLQFTLQPPFDVDVTLANAGDAARCPDLSGKPEPPGFNTYRTTIRYLVSLTNPALPALYAGTYWQFRFTVTATGQGGGSSATVYEITADDGNNGSTDNTYTPASGLSTYSHDYSVLSANSAVLFTVTYNDVLGTEQNVRFELTAIEGSFLEIDVDANDRVDHIIYSMPDAGDIEAMN